MRGFNIKLILLTGLFAALVIKGGQLCSAEGVQAMTRLVEPARPASVEPLPIRPVEEEFRGVSPLPGLAERAMPARKVVKPPQSSSQKAKPHASTKDAARKPAKKS